MKILALFLLTISLTLQASDFSCKSPEGKSVDWWVILKMPKPHNEGQKYYYYDNNMSKADFDLHEDINGKDSPFLQTIAQVQDLKSEDNFLFFWNDQPEDKESIASTYAHAKGISGGDDKQGFVIVHSVPRLLHLQSHKIVLEIPENQLQYGQHFFCMSLDAENLNTYARGLVVDRVYAVDDSHIPEKWHSIYPNFLQALEKKTNDFEYEVIDINTVGGNSFTKFAKSYHWQKDFYRNVVAPEYKSDFTMETWGRSLQDPDCERDMEYNVVSNLEVHFSDEINYSYTKDHSKYGISDADIDVVCFGDVNRMTSQDKRGGGTVCWVHKQIHKFLKNAFVKQQECGVSD